MVARRIERHDPVAARRARGLRDEERLFQPGFRRRATPVPARQVDPRVRYLLGTDPAHQRTVAFGVVAQHPRVAVVVVLDLEERPQVEVGGPIDVQHGRGRVRFHRTGPLVSGNHLHSDRVRAPGRERDNGALGAFDRQAIPGQQADAVAAGRKVEDDRRAHRGRRDHVGGRTLRRLRLFQRAHLRLQFAGIRTPVAQLAALHHQLAESFLVRRLGALKGKRRIPIRALLGQVFPVDPVRVIAGGYAPVQLILAAHVVVGVVDHAHGQRLAAGAGYLQRTGHRDVQAALVGEPLPGNGPEVDEGVTRGQKVVDIRDQVDRVRLLAGEGRRVMLAGERGGSIDELLLPRRGLAPCRPACRGQHQRRQRRLPDPRRRHPRTPRTPSVRRARNSAAPASAINAAMLSRYRPQAPTSAKPAAKFQ